MPWYLKDPAYNWKKQALTLIQFPEGSPDILPHGILQILEDAAIDNTQHLLRISDSMQFVWEQRKTFLTNIKSAYNQLPYYLQKLKFDFKVQPFTSIQFPESASDKISPGDLQQLENAANQNVPYTQQLPDTMSIIWTLRKTFLNRQKGMKKRWAENNKIPDETTKKQKKNDALPIYLSLPAYNFKQQPFNCNPIS